MITNKLEPAKEKYITIQTVAKRLNCTKQYVYILIREGKLQAVKIGKRALRIAESSFDRFIASNLVNPADYFAPAVSKPAMTDPRPAITTVRSTWMSSKKKNS